MTAVERGAAAVGVALRPGVPADAPALARIHREARAAAMPGLHEPWTEAQVAAWIAAVLMAPPRRVVVAEAAGEAGPVGYLGLDPACGEVLHLYVEPAWQGRGVGGRLLDAARVAAAPGGLALFCFRRNHAALAFYGRRGFRMTARRRGPAVNEEGEPDVRLAWTPAPQDRTRGVNA
jgi:ribosomal protein S18 acetylase RimI-like enzyme